MKESLVRWKSLGLKELFALKESKVLKESFALKFIHIAELRDTQCPRMKMNKSFENQQRDLCREVQHASEVPKNYSL